MNIKEIAGKLSDLSSEVTEGFDFEQQIIPGEEDVLQITLTDREEIPVYITLTDTQMLCLSYLWHENEVKPESHEAMVNAMLEMNIPMPLSSFSKIADRYVIFGALSLNSSIEDIAHEIVTLSDNAIDSIEVMSDFLK